MIQDPIVEEVHRIREKLSRKFQFDIRKIFEDVKQREQQHRDRIVNLRGKPIKITSQKNETREAV
jgi:NAD dependent epimerase/dehydratase family enzyme